jgi:hypothetical protein
VFTSFCFRPCWHRPRRVSRFLWLETQQWLTSHRRFKMGLYIPICFFTLPLADLWNRWGFPFQNYINLKVVNLARGGRSARSYIREGLWASLVTQIDAGDYVIMEFGHNDACVFQTLSEIFVPIYLTISQRHPTNIRQSPNTWNRHRNNHGNTRRRKYRGCADLRHLRKEHG